MAQCPPLNTPLLSGYGIESFRYTLISLILSSQQFRAGKKSRLFGSVAISVKIKLSDTFPSKSWPSLAIRFL